MSFKGIVTLFWIDIIQCFIHSNCLVLSKGINRVMAETYGNVDIECHGIFVYVRYVLCSYCYLNLYLVGPLVNKKLLLLLLQKNLKSMYWINHDTKLKTIRDESRNICKKSYHFTPSRETMTFKNTFYISDTKLVNSYFVVISCDEWLLATLVIRCRCSVAHTWLFSARTINHLAFLRLRIQVKGSFYKHFAGLTYAEHAQTLLLKSWIAQDQFIDNSFIIWHLSRSQFAPRLYICCHVSRRLSLQWRHNGRRDGVSNHQPHDFLLYRLCRRRSKKYQRPASLAYVCRIQRSPVNSPGKGPVTRKMFPFDDVIMNVKHVTI